MLMLMLMKRVTNSWERRGSCDEDWVEIWNVMSHAEDALVGRYCHLTAPGPVESREEAEALKIIMRTDGEGVFSGFKARYSFFTATTLYGGKTMKISNYKLLHSFMIH